MEEFIRKGEHDNHVAVYVDGEFVGNYSSISDYKVEKDRDKREREKEENGE